MRDNKRKPDGHETKKAARGLPETFASGGSVYTRDEIFRHVDETRKKLGPEMAVEVLETLLEDFRFRDEAVEAYKEYGKDMWTHLESRRR